MYEAHDLEVVNDDGVSPLSVGFWDPFQMAQLHGL